MGRNKSTFSKAQSYKEIGEFWGSHALVEHWEQTEPVEFEVEEVMIREGFRRMSRDPNTDQPQPGQPSELPPTRPSDPVQPEPPPLPPDAPTPTAPVREPS